MEEDVGSTEYSTTSRAKSGRPLRADAKRNIGIVVEAARETFASSGVDAPMREIADRANVGVGTIYRNFPQRADLIAAVFRHEVDACANSAQELAADHTPGKAFALWMERYVEFIAAKRGLASALHSGAPAFDALPAYFDRHLEPALARLMQSAVEAGEMQDDISAHDLLRAAASLCAPDKTGDPAHAKRLVGLLVDGLRFRGKNA